MPVDWDSLILQMDWGHLAAKYEGDNAQSDVNLAWNAWSGSDDHVCLYYTLSAVDHLETCPEDIVGWFLWGENGFSGMIPTAFRILKEEIASISPDVTMDAILSAMLQADPIQVEYFIGLVDAFKQSIWNKPFNKDFYAALARGFMEWP